MISILIEATLISRIISLISLLCYPSAGLTLITTYRRGSLTFRLRPRISPAYVAAIFESHAFILCTFTYSTAPLRIAQMRHL
jgi:hypothetical protein